MNKLPYKKLRKAEDVLNHLKHVRSDIMKNYNLSNLQKEKLFYETRYIFITNLIEDIQERI